MSHEKARFGNFAKDSSVPHADRTLDSDQRALPAPFRSSLWNVAETGGPAQIWMLIMPSSATADGLRTKNMLALAVGALPLVLVEGSLAIAAQDRYALKIPGICAVGLRRRDRLV
jgi:hypothetical protein